MAGVSVYVGTYRSEVQQWETAAVDLSAENASELSWVELQLEIAA